MKSPKSQGFTLIELLVVISVLAILIAIIIPAAGKTIKQAKSAQCQSNLQQWGIYWQAYLNDHNGKFSRGLVNIKHDYDVTHNTDIVEINNTGGNGSGWARGEWARLLKDYLGAETSLLTCPEATERLVVGTSTKAWGSHENTYLHATWRGQVVGRPSSYGVNCWVYNPPHFVIRSGSTTPVAVTHIQGRRVADHWRDLFNHQDASSIPLILDAMWRGGGPGDDREVQRFYRPPDFNGQWIPQGGYGYEMMHFALDRHYGAVNGVMIDGSVKRIPVAKLWGLKWHRTYDIDFESRISLPRWIRELPQ